MNSLINYPVPNWIAVAFLCVIFIPSVMLAFLAAKGFPGKKNVFFKVIGFFALYFSYVSVASFTGWFDKVFLPPLVLLYCTFPLASFLFTVVIHSNWYKEFLNNVSLESLVQIHIFRLIGVFFILLAFYNALPKFFGFIAGVGDIATAISSILIARAIRKKYSNARTLTIIWNIFGFSDIVFTAVTAILLTKLSIDHGTMGVDTLAKFPYCFIPAFAPPVIIFLHVSIFKKVRKTFA